MFQGQRQPSVAEDSLCLALLLGTVSQIICAKANAVHKCLYYYYYTMQCLSVCLSQASFM